MSLFLFSCDSIYGLWLLSCIFIVVELYPFNCMVALRILPYLNKEDYIIKITCKLFSASSFAEQKGTSYIRWGRKTCKGNATLVYKGKWLYWVNWSQHVDVITRPFSYRPVSYMAKIHLTRFAVTSPYTGKLPTSCGLVTDLCMLRTCCRLATGKLV